jgi:hypothetical protein
MLRVQDSGDSNVEKDFWMYGLRELVIAAATAEGK